VFVNEECCVKITSGLSPECVSLIEMCKVFEGCGVVDRSGIVDGETSLSVIMNDTQDSLSSRKIIESAV
jgi:hypothetical protein